MEKVICFDIGGTNLRAALINEKYETLKTVKTRTQCGKKAVLVEQIVNVITDLLEEQEGITKIVFGVPGRVRKTDYIIEDLPNIGVKNLDLVEIINEHFPELKTYVYNDAELAGLYEAFSGNGRNYKRVFYVTVSTGLGGALFVNKKWAPSSYEIGHTLYDYLGETHEIEHLCSGHGLVKLARKHGLESHSSKEVFQGFKLCSPQYVFVVEEWLNLLAKFFQDIQDTYNPDVIIIGGGVAFEYTTFIYSLKSRTPKIKYRVSSKIDDSGLLGGVSLITSLRGNVHPFEE